jgi:hypothetical protein
MTEFALEDAPLDVIIEPGAYFEGRNLTPEERSIVFGQDIWVVSFVSSLSQRQQDLIGKAFGPLDMGHYLNLQRKEWFEREKKELKAQLGHEPTQGEIVVDCEKHRNFERYKLCYVLILPKGCYLHTENYSKPRIQELADGFMSTAQRLHPQHFPYFEVLARNGVIESSRMREMDEFERQLEERERLLAEVVLS